MALLITMAWLGLTMTDLPNTPHKARLYGLHKSIGLTILALAVLRLGWRLYAGAPRVIASLWKVDDEATTELMKLFYRNLLQNQVSASAALSAAQAEMRAQPRWRSPYYWAAFTLQGDWR